MIETLLSHLSGVKNSGNGHYSACCPLHDDSHSSLSITLSDGKILAHCHAGCDQHALAEHLGLNGSGPTKTTRREIAHYDYVDENGELLYQKVRFEPKTFRQRKPEGDGWNWKLGTVRRVLYRLPELLKGMSDGRTVFVVEGEKDVENLRKLGLVATTCTEGASKDAQRQKWRPEYTQCLKSAKRLVILPDNDDPGRAFAQFIAGELSKAGVADIRIVELPGLAEKQDVSDWILKGGTKEALKGLVNSFVSFVSSIPGHIQENFLWPDPEPLPSELSPVVRFDTDWLPNAFKDWIKDISERMQAPIDYPAIGAMVALGSLVGRQVAIRPKRKDDWTVYPNLWGCAVGRPSQMKSPALTEVLKPLTRLEIDAKQDFDNRVKEHAVNSMIHSAKKKQLENTFKAMLKKGETPKASNFIEDLIEPDQPARRRYLVNDATVEKLGELLNENPNGLMVFRDELIGFLKSLDREGREMDRGFYLEAWNGNGRFTYDRIGRGTIDIESCIVSILGGIQPGPLGEYVRGAVKGGKGDDGLLQRFQLLAWPDPSETWVNVDEWPDKEAKNRAFEVFTRLSDIPNKGEYSFTDDAQEFFNDWREDLENRIRSEEHPAVEAHLAKYRSLIPSLALILHLADSDHEKVGIEPLSKAIAWGRYLESHARRLYGFILYSEVVSAKSLLKHIKKGDLPIPFKAREIRRKGWAGMTDQQSVETAIYVLEEYGYIAQVEIEKDSNPGRKPSPSYSVNPKIFTDTQGVGTDKTDKTIFESKNFTDMPTQGTDKTDKTIF